MSALSLQTFWDKHSRHYRRDLRLALPIVFSNLGHMLVGLADSVMIGQLGTEHLAAASLANSFFMLILVFGFGLSVAITPLVANADGKGDLPMLSSLLMHGLVLFTAVGVAFFLASIPGSAFLFYIDQPEAVATLAQPYFLILMGSLIPLMVFQGCKQFAEGVSSTRPAMVIVLAASGLNVLLNWLLISGHWGFPALGLNGAGWASLLSRTLMAAAMAAFLSFPHMAKRYRLHLRLRDLTRTTLERLLKLGIPISLQMIFEVGAFSGAAVMIGWLGAEQLAAHQIALSLAAVTYMMANGLSAAATVRVGNQLGQRHFHDLREAAFSIYHLVLALMGLAAILFVVLRFQLPALFVDEPEVISLAAGLLIIAALFQLSDGVQVAALGALRGMEDVRIPTIIAFTAYWLLALPIAYLFGFVLNWGITGVWIGLWLGLTVAALLLTWRFHRRTLHLLEENASMAAEPKATNSKAAPGKM